MSFVHDFRCLPWSRFMVFVTTVLIVSLFPDSVWARNENPGVLPPHSTAHGATYGEWGARWWQWAYGQPADVNPVLDETGEHCAEGQSGKVWFLAGTFGGEATRECTIPTGTTLFFPVANIAWVTMPGDPDFYENEQAIRDLLASYLQEFLAGTLIAEVDGVEIKNLAAYQVVSPIFDVYFPEGNVAGLDPGTYGPSLDAGIYLMLAPLPPGVHMIHFGVEAPTVEFSVDVTYMLTVAPGGKGGGSVVSTGDGEVFAWDAAAITEVEPSNIFLPFAATSQNLQPFVDEGINLIIPCAGPDLAPGDLDVVICS